MENKLSPIIKWAGGKEKELPIIISNLPEKFENYFEPFVGGGAVFTAMKSGKYFINDKSSELINLYNAIKQKNNDFFIYSDTIIELWSSVSCIVEKHKEIQEKYIIYRTENLTKDSIKDLFVPELKNVISDIGNNISEILPKKDILIKEIEKNFFDKLLRMNKLEKKIHILLDEDIYLNIETGFLSGVYMYLRNLYNDKTIMQNKSLYTSLFFFIRNYCYSGMFRYNTKGDFNVPYGGIGYNKKSLTKKIEYYKSEELVDLLKKTEIYNLDFEDFLIATNPTEKDFIFLDPPYDSDFSTYAKNTFDKTDQKRLADYLIYKCKAKWMMIIKNTPYIFSLYNNNNLNIKSFDKTYLVSFMNRNDKKTEHLLITNY